MNDLGESSSPNQNIKSSTDGINNSILDNTQVKGIHQSSNNSFRNIKYAGINNYNIQQLDSSITIKINNSFNQELIFSMDDAILSDLSAASYSQVINYYQLPSSQRINLDNSLLSDL